jgi:membrane fusion protein, multidrug efflux system
MKFLKMNFMKTKFLVLMAGLFIISCGKQDKMAELQKLKKQRDELNVQITKVEEEIRNSGIKTDDMDYTEIAVKILKTQAFNHYIDVQGKIDGDDNVNVSPKMMGVVKRILVQQGASVSKGQVLAELDDQVLQQSIQEINTGLAFATNMYNKQKNLWDQKIGSEVQYLGAKNQKESLEKRLATILEQLDMMKIKSPIEGTVEDIPIKIGMNAAPGMTTFRVINFSSIKAVAEVAESYASKIKTGDSVLVYLPDLKRDIAARLNFSSRYINPVNRTFMVEIHLNANEPDLRANMIAVLKINDYTNPSTIVIPVNVIQNTQNGKYVFIACNENNKNVVKKRDVTIGLTYNGLTEIKSGLIPGDVLITSGYQDLKEGQLIKF